MKENNMICHADEKGAFLGRATAGVKMQGSFFTASSMDELNKAIRDAKGTSPAVGGSCPAKTASGNPCKGRVTNSGFCPAHTPKA